MNPALVYGPAKLLWRIFSFAALNYLNPLERCGGDLHSELYVKEKRSNAKDFGTIA